MPQMRRHEEKFKEYMRMNMPVFNTLLELIPEDIEKSTTNIWRPILVLIKDATSILQDKGTCRVLGDIQGVYH